MRIVYIGTSHLGKHVLEDLLKMKVNVVGVIGYYQHDNEDWVDIKLSTPKDVPFRNGLDAVWIKDKGPDFIFCVGWHEIIKRDMLDIAPVIGYHPTLLPEGRGCAPIIWATIKKLPRTGSTFFWMDEGIDTGDILNQKVVEMHKGEPAKDLYYRIVNIARKQIKVIIPQLESWTAPKVPQDHSKATYWRKRILGEDEWIEYL